MSEPIWSLHLGDGPLVATAVHNGHAIRAEVLAYMALGEAARLREEDPFTAEWTLVAPTRVVGLRSRFEVDLNRPRDKAVYRAAADAWGLNVWKNDPPRAIFDRSLEQYDAFYAAMRELLAGIAAEHGKFVVFDLHTYNHRRRGPGNSPADSDANPQVNVGTGTMNRHWAGPVVDSFISSLRAYDFPGGKLDVRENVKFRGGNWPRWIHETFPESGIAIAIEFKKFFMDEWTGEPDPAAVEAIGAALRSTVPGVLDALERI
jgi:N-formylglutamate amidohydrolase